MLPQGGVASVVDRGELLDAHFPDEAAHQFTGAVGCARLLQELVGGAPIWAKHSSSEMTKLVGGLCECDMLLGFGIGL